ncbi:MAG: RNase H family protein [Sulfuricaulis sp.]|uniref:RNase H family protein n=1 Tax=Sulfuricaulis sp. TaxID=2003553 RepID=UPI003C50538B
MVSGLGIIDEYALNIFTDGSSYPKKQRAAGVGVCLVWVNESGDEEYEEYAPPGWQNATIDEMEIEACTVAVQEAKRFLKDKNRFKRILIFSDSRYEVENYFKAMHIWPNKRWLGANGMPVANIDLWKRLRKEVKNYPIKVDIKWVKAHKSNKYNRAANKLAQQSASLPFNKPLSHSQTTRKWSDRNTKRGCVPVLGQEAKIRIISREYVKKAKTYEYRYEVIDPDDKSFKDLDFVFCNEYLSRNKCFQVRFNSEQKRPFILEIIQELECSKYKY